MDITEKERIDKEMGKLVVKARTYLQNNPLKVACPEGIPQAVLLGMSFEVTSLDFMQNIITFKIIG